jgi:hypothetical protein
MPRKPQGFPAPQPGGQVDQLLVRSRASRGEHLRRQEHDVPAGAFDLDEIARAKIGDPRGVEWHHRHALASELPQKFSKKVACFGDRQYGL